MTIQTTYKPIPRRWPFKACARREKSSCPIKIKSVNSQGIPVTGNTNLPGFALTSTGPGGRFPTMIKSAFDISSRGGVNCSSRPKTTFLSRPVNVFGRWAGAPGGSGKPPSNF